MLSKRERKLTSLWEIRRCENWYHLDCVAIPEDKVELVDQFVCPVCESGRS